MKINVILIAVLGLLLVGCQKWHYDHPLTQTHNLPVDSSILGLWEWIPEKTGGMAEDDEFAEDEEPPEINWLMILKFSDTEYMINFGSLDSRDSVNYFVRGYLVELGGIKCVQLNLIGGYENFWGNGQVGDLCNGKERMFHVVSYHLLDDVLEIKLLNNSLVDPSVETQEALVEAFLKHKDNAELFNTELFDDEYITDSMKYKRVKD